MKCTRCGAENAVFCGRCGKPFSDVVVGHNMPTREPGQAASNNDHPATSRGFGLARFLGITLVVIGFSAALLVTASTALSVSRATTSAQATEDYLEGAVELLLLVVSFLALNATILLFKKR